MQLDFWEQQLAFEYPFTISNGRTKTHQHSLMIRLSLGNWQGFGEAPAIVYYNVTVEDMMEQLEKSRKLIEKFALIDPERFWHFLHHLFPKDPFLVSALDMAGWDLFGQMKKQPIHEIWNLPWNENTPTPVCDYTLGIDTIDKMVEKMKAHPWPIYKVKVGTDYDIDMIYEGTTIANAKSSQKFTVQGDSSFDVPTNAYIQFKGSEGILDDLGLSLLKSKSIKVDFIGDMNIVFGGITKKVIFNTKGVVLTDDLAETIGIDKTVGKINKFLEGLGIKI